MLGRALDAAESNERQQIAARPPSNSTAVLTAGGGSEYARVGYGSTEVGDQGRGDDGQKQQEEDDESIEDDPSYINDWQDDQGQSSSSPDEPSILQRLGECWRFVANVDDVWDSPQIGISSSSSEPPTGSHNISGGHGGVNNRQMRNGQHQQNHQNSSRRSYVVVLFWFSILSTTYATERVSFKLIVDRMGPFRLFSAEIIVATHAIVLGIIMLVNAFQMKKIEFKSLGLPLVDVGLMAVLDTIHLVLTVTTGSYVSPTMTVTLVQFTIPLTAFFTQFVHPSGACSGLCFNSQSQEEAERDEECNETGGGETQRLRSNDDCARRGEDEDEDDTTGNCGGLGWEHIWGSAILFAAVMIGLTPSFMAFKNPTKFESQDTVPIRYAYNTIVFALSCIPAAASQLYKEHTLFRHKQPVDVNYLNLILSIFQFVVAMVLSPLIYTLQGLGGGDNWASMYPSKEVSKNFVDGLKCFFGILDPDIAKNEYPEYAQCNLSWLIVLVHVMTIIVIGYAVDKIVHAGSTKVMYRGISVGIILAIFAMYLYEYFDPFLNYGTVINSLHLACTVLVILGAEVYHRVNIQDATFETVYPEMENLYDDEFG